MPELPEVEAARWTISETCAGKRIVRAVVADDPQVIDSPKDFEAALVGKTLIAAHRRGKNLWLQLDSPPFPSFQFGMAGAVYIKGVPVTQYRRSAVNDNDEWPSKYSKLLIELDDGLEISFTDKRRFAKVRLLKDPTAVPPISELGPDALLQPMAVDEFHEKASKTKILIKALLLDQSFISGIGNWIADEVLYQARIHPGQFATSLSRESCENLTNCIKKVIKTAVEVGADSSRYPNNWIFHSREKKSGKAFVDGKKITISTIAGRTTAYVRELQKLDGKKAAKAADGKQKTRNSKAKGGQGEKQDEDVEESSQIDPVSKEELTNITVGGRTTAYVPELQKLDGNDAAKAVDGKQKSRNLKAKEGQGDEGQEEGRTTAYVPELQKLDGNDAAKAVDGKQKSRNLKAKDGQGDAGQDEGRTTAYVPELQKLDDDDAAKAVDGKQKSRNLKAKEGQGDEGQDEGTTTAYVPELQKLDGNDAAKAVDGKQKSRNLKAKEVQGDEGQDEDIEESNPVDRVSKEEEIANIPNKRRELKPRARGKRPPPKRKTKTDEVDNINDDGYEVDDGEDDNRDKSGRRVTGRNVRQKVGAEKVTSQVAGMLKKTVK